MIRKKEIPRGIRNNNPLNIRIGNVWLGEVNHPTDPSFEQFVSMEYGLRAAFVLLRRYIVHYHRCTIREIVGSWAPSSENNTEAYIRSVVTFSGIDEGQVLSYSDAETMYKLVAAMARVECGQEIDEKKIRKAYTMA